MLEIFVVIHTYNSLQMLISFDGSESANAQPTQGKGTLPTLQQKLRKSVKHKDKVLERPTDIQNFARNSPGPIFPLTQRFFPRKCITAQLSDVVLNSSTPEYFYETVFIIKSTNFHSPAKRRRRKPSVIHISNGALPRMSKYCTYVQSL